MTHERREHDAGDAQAPVHRRPAREHQRCLRDVERQPACEDRRVEVNDPRECRYTRHELRHVGGREAGEDGDRRDAGHGAEEAVIAWTGLKRTR